MKKIIFITLAIILIPFLIVTLFVKEEETEFSLVTNQNVRIKRDKLNRIDTMPMEEYIVGVVAGEMPVSFNIEALKAQAIAARNYAIKKVIANKDKEYDLIDTTDNQVYLDIETLINTDPQNEKNLDEDDSLKKVNNHKKIEVINGGNDLDISPVTDYIEVEKPKNEKKENIIIPESND